MEKIIVKTSKGDIIVSVKQDNTYPEVYVEFLNKDNEEERIVTIEYEPNKEKVQAVVYAEGQNEEPTHIIEVQNIY